MRAFSTIDIRHTKPKLRRALALLFAAALVIAGAYFGFVLFANLAFAVGREYRTQFAYGWIGAAIAAAMTITAQAGFLLIVDRRLLGTSPTWLPLLIVVVAGFWCLWLSFLITDFCISGSGF